jgi:hypothetical protein
LVLRSFMDSTSLPAGEVLEYVRSVTRNGEKKSQQGTALCWKDVAAIAWGGEGQLRPGLVCPSDVIFVPALAEHTFRPQTDLVLLVFFAPDFSRPTRRRSEAVAPRA